MSKEENENLVRREQNNNYFLDSFERHVSHTRTALVESIFGKSIL